MDKCSPQTTVERQLKARRPPDAHTTSVRSRLASVVKRTPPCGFTVCVCGALPGSGQVLQAGSLPGGAL